MFNDRCVGNQPALLVKITVRFKPAKQGQMHDLRQRRCPIITPTRLCPKLSNSAKLLRSNCQSKCKVIARKQNPSRSQIVGLWF